MSRQATVYVASLPDSMRININTPPLGCTVTPSPTSGAGLSKLFGISVGACQDDDTPLLFQFFLYFSAEKME